MNNVILSLGANLENRSETMENALLHIAENIGNITQISPIYESEPWGFEAENWFLNQVISVETECSAMEILEKIDDIERVLGRARRGDSRGCPQSPWCQIETYQSRKIDIDILYFNTEIINSKNLQIPHKHLHSRKFVLMPLNDILPNFKHPILQQTTSELLHNCQDFSTISIYTLCQENIPTSPSKA